MPDNLPAALAAQLPELTPEREKDLALVRNFIPIDARPITAYALSCRVGKSIGWLDHAIAEIRDRVPDMPLVTENEGTYTGYHFVTTKRLARKWADKRLSLALVVLLRTLRGSIFPALRAAGVNERTIAGITRDFARLVEDIQLIRAETGPRPPTSK